MCDVLFFVLFLIIGVVCIDCYIVGRFELFCFFGIFSFLGLGGSVNVDCVLIIFDCVIEELNV